MTKYIFVSFVWLDSTFRTCVKIWWSFGSCYCGNIEHSEGFSTFQQDCIQYILSNTKHIVMNSSINCNNTDVINVPQWLLCMYQSNELVNSYFELLDAHEMSKLTDSLKWINHTNATYERAFYTRIFDHFLSVFDWIKLCKKQHSTSQH